MPASAMRHSADNVRMAVQQNMLLSSRLTSDSSLTDKIVASVALANVASAHVVCAHIKAANLVAATCSMAHHLSLNTLSSCTGQTLESSTLAG